MAQSKTLTKKVRRELAEIIKTYPCAANTQEEAERLFVELFEGPKIADNSNLPTLDDKRAYVLLMLRGKFHSNKIDEDHSWMREGVQE